jgi:hypothetical protein
MTKGKFVDLTGQRVGNKTVIKRSEKPETNNSNDIFWECLCDKGHVTIVAGTRLRNGKSNTCSKCFKGIDETGNIYGLWRVLEYSCIKNSSTYWRCECTSCKKIYDVSINSLRRGISNGCSNCIIRLSEGEGDFNNLYYRYKKSAKIRNLPFEIEKEYFKKITKESCFYCGIEPSQVSNDKKCFGNYIYNGIDRRNNQIGYLEDNCVPCCKNCNRAKMEMSEQEFRSWIERVHTHSHRNDSIPVNISQMFSAY